MATIPLLFRQDKKEAEERKRLEQQAKTDELLKDQRSGGHGIFPRHFGGHRNQTFLSFCENMKKQHFPKSSE